VEFSGWDTHANQGTRDGPLDRLLGQLAQGLTAFKSAMGEDWAGTTVVVMTEFGRKSETQRHSRDGPRYRWRGFHTRDPTGQERGGDGLARPSRSAALRGT